MRTHSCVFIKLGGKIDSRCQLKLTQIATVFVFDFHFRHLDVDVDAFARRYVAMSLCHFVFLFNTFYMHFIIFLHLRNGMCAVAFGALEHTFPALFTSIFKQFLSNFIASSATHFVFASFAPLPTLLQVAQLRLLTDCVA